MLRLPLPDAGKVERFGRFLFVAAESGRNFSYPGLVVLLLLTLRENVIDLSIVRGKPHTQSVQVTRPAQERWPVLTCPDSQCMASNSSPPPFTVTPGGEFPSATKRTDPVDTSAIC